jgi:hypothetical protein
MNTYMCVWFVVAVNFKSCVCSRVKILSIEIILVGFDVVLLDNALKEMHSYRERKSRK